MYTYTYTSHLGGLEELQLRRERVAVCVAPRPVAPLEQALQAPGRFPEAPGKAPGVPLEAPGGHRQVHGRPPGNPRRRPGGSREAPGRRPGGSRDAPDRPGPALQNVKNHWFLLFFGGSEGLERPKMAPGWAHLKLGGPKPTLSGLQMGPGWLQEGPGGSSGGFR